MVAAGETPQATAAPRPKRRALQLTRTTSISLPSKPLKAPSPPKSPLPARTLALVRPPTPPCGFAGVVACLRTLELVEVDWEMPFEHQLKPGSEGRHHGAGVPRYHNDFHREDGPRWFRT